MPLSSIDLSNHTNTHTYTHMHTLNTTLNTADMCVYDTVTLKWSSSDDPRNYSLVFSVDEESDVTYSDLIDHSYPLHTHTYTVIHCDIDEEHCVVSISGVVARDGKLIISFDRDTNEPNLLTASSLASALALDPPIVGSAVGEWIDAKTLEVTVSEEYYSMVLNASEERKLSVEVGIGTPHPSSEKEVLSGQYLFRPSRPGEYHIFIVRTASMTLASSVHPLSVKVCGENIAPLVSTADDMGGIRHDNVVEERFPPKPLVHYRGVLALSGQKNGGGITIPHNLLPISGSWSLSMWLRMSQGPTGSFRTLFYKGDGTDPNRTPSAWLLPSTSRIAIRASTPSNPDLGSDTVLDIPTRKWVHLTFVMRNSTTEKPGAYAVSVYQNGVLDVALTYTDIVIPNSFPLRLFCDPSHAGPRGFAADVVVWDSALTTANVKALAMHSSSSQYEILTRPVDIALSFVQTHPKIDPRPLSGVDLVGSLQAKCSGTACESTSYDILPSSPSKETSDQLQNLLDRIDSAVTDCLPPAERLDMYAEASSLGHIESLYKWSMLIGFGSEVSQSSCGIEEFSPRDQKYHTATAFSDPDELNCGPIDEAFLSDQVKCAIGLLLAAQNGHSQAFVPLSTMVSTAVGLGPLGMDMSSPAGRCFLQRIVELIPAPVEKHVYNEQGITRGVRVDGNYWVDVNFVFRLSEFMRTSLGVVQNSTSVAPLPYSQMGLTNRDHNIRSRQGAAFEMEPHTSVFSLRYMGDAGNNMADPFSHLSTGFLFLAAQDGHGEAQLALAKRYRSGVKSLDACPEIASLYAQMASVVSAEEYHKVGGQPILEEDKLTDMTEKEVVKGNSGSDDEQIQLLTVQAEEGHVPSMLSLGEMYYYGARGLPRDQVRALELYNNAAAAGNEHAMCGAAAMLLKGEGGPKNVSRAVALYDEAASKGLVRAFNGLGYVYFFGHGDEAPMNKTKAFHYFLLATESGGDSDSWFNAGYCLENGIGTEEDVARAASFYLTAATKFGHFDSVLALGNMHLQGKGVVRSPTEALTYLSAANDVGPWVGWLRRGFNQYVHGQSTGIEKYYERSVLCYLHSGELGYEVSQSNTAFILRRKLNDESESRLFGQSEASLIQVQGGAVVSTSEMYERLLVRQLALSASQGNAESAQSLGSHILRSRDSYMLKGVTQMVPSSKFSTSHRPYIDYDKEEKLLTLRGQAALWWFSKASAMGSALGSLQCGMMYHFGIGTGGINIVRAKRYYDHVLQSDSNDMHQSMLIVAKTLNWVATECEKSYMMRNVNSFLGWVVRWLLVGKL